MFTGIIKDTGKFKTVGTIGGKRKLYVEVEEDFKKDVNIGDSIAVNGVCLSVIEKNTQVLGFDVLDQTYNNTAIKFFSAGKCLNLEKALLVSQRLDGHIVTGHVDVVGKISTLSRGTRQNVIEIGIGESCMRNIVEKGSICLDGISLTIAEIKQNSFVVCVIPFTFAQTNISCLKVSDYVNIEFDILGKYAVNRAHSKDARSVITDEFLREKGFL